MSQAPGAQPSPPSVYHERQRLELCAVHALNNVLQQQLFSQEAADEICKRLAPDSRLNPHRSLLGTGNYDVNVIMAALQGQGLAAVWWDRRRPLSQLALPRVLGLILNLPSPVSLGLLSLPLRRRHWVALRQVDGVYYNLDSKLRAPEVLGDEDGVRPQPPRVCAQGLPGGRAGSRFVRGAAGGNQGGGGAGLLAAGRLTPGGGAHGCPPGAAPETSLPSKRRGRGRTPRGLSGGPAPAPYAPPLPGLLPLLPQ
uniref:ubiquitinyl hydrolase 1 n=1 Tax=Bos taurus TaxID=9913 RepID=F1ME39_BOVIN